MKVTVIGQGYVGLTLATEAASAGHEVVGLEIDEKLVINLLNGKTLVPGIISEAMLDLIKDKRYLPTTNTEKMQGSDVIVIAVPTPLNTNRSPELKYIIEAATQIAQNCKEKVLVVNESTSYPGTLRNIIKPTIEAISNIDFMYASAPERIDPGNEKWSLQNTPRIVGGLTSNAGALAVKFYESFCTQVNLVSSPEVAEAAKLFENTFRHINIALVNEFAIISNALGFSANEVINAAATKPFGFMPFFPSIGVGGHCIPVDPTYLSYAASEVGVRTNFIDLANKTNLSMVNYTIERIIKILNRPVSDLRIQIAGIAYKPNVADLRESPVLDLISELRRKGAKVTWSDPLVMEWNGEVSENLSEEVDLGIVAVPHEKINFSVWKKNTILVIDLSSTSDFYGWTKIF